MRGRTFWNWGLLVGLFISGYMRRSANVPFDDVEFELEYRSCFGSLLTFKGSDVGVTQSHHMSAGFTRSLASRTRGGTVEMS